MACDASTVMSGDLVQRFVSYPAGLEIEVTDHRPATYRRVGVVDDYDHEFPRNPLPALTYRR